VGGRIVGEWRRLAWEPGNGGKKSKNRGGERGTEVAGCGGVARAPGRSRNLAFVSRPRGLQDTPTSRRLTACSAIQLCRGFLGCVFTAKTAEAQRDPPLPSQSKPGLGGTSRSLL